jgi:N-acetylmuramic acid 6-phosphate etherase
MVDVQRSNLKLVSRARAIFRSILSSLPLSISFDLDDDDAIDTLIDACEGSVKQAMIAARWDCSPSDAKCRLERADGMLKKAIM